eukprot:GFYU01000419.1.p1 GENE.GFYU01000419.1~~GFYU01000419.1.p1  ORF type:complete len:424 (-),score=92.29 GFYU01000419.1:136-1407(-)
MSVVDITNDMVTPTDRDVNVSATQDGWSRSRGSSETSEKGTDQQDQRGLLINGEFHVQHLEGSGTYAQGSRRYGQLYATTSSPLGPFQNQSVCFKGTSLSGGNTVLYRFKISFKRPVVLNAVTVTGCGFYGSRLSVLSSAGNQLGWKTLNFEDDRYRTLMVKPDKGKLWEDSEFFIVETHNAAQVCSRNNFSLDFSYVKKPVAQGPTLVSEMKALCNNKELSDVVFHVEGQQLYAVSAILAARCDQFRAMFFGNMKEARTKEVHVEDMAYETFKIFLEYLYTDELPNLPSEMLIEVFVAADRYTINRLKDLCVRDIKDSVSDENIVRLLTVADRHHSEALKNYCLDYIVEHRESVSTLPEFDELASTPDLLLEVTKELAQCQLMSYGGPCGPDVYLVYGNNGAPSTHRAVRKRSQETPSESRE